MVGGEEIAVHLPGKGKAVAGGAVGGVVGGFIEGKLPRVLGEALEEGFGGGLRGGKRHLGGDVLVPGKTVGIEGLHLAAAGVHGEAAVGDVAVFILGGGVLHGAENALRLLLLYQPIAGAGEGEAVQLIGALCADQLVQLLAAQHAFQLFNAGQLHLRQRPLGGSAAGVHVALGGCGRGVVEAVKADIALRRDQFAGLGIHILRGGTLGHIAQHGLCLVVFIPDVDQFQLEGVPEGRRGGILRHGGLR